MQINELREAVAKKKIAGHVSELYHLAHRGNEHHEQKVRVSL